MGSRLQDLFGEKRTSLPASTSDIGVKVWSLGCGMWRRNLYIGTIYSLKDSFVYCMFSFKQVPKVFAKSLVEKSISLANVRFELRFLVPFFSVFLCVCSTFVRVTLTLFFFQHVFFKQLFAKKHTFCMRLLSSSFFPSKNQ